MARFIGHESCPACGSRDNLGRYEDGSAFCFGCKYTEKANHAARRVFKEIVKDESSTPRMPDDTGTNYSREAVDWMSQYHLSVEEAIKAGIRWSDSRQQLIFLLEDGCWQARNFSHGIKPRSKYFTAGNVNDSIKVYQRSESSSETGGRLLEVVEDCVSTVGDSTEKCLAIVEDCVSAIRIAGSGTDAMPVLGSHVSKTKLNRIARLYSSLIVWLDHDKLKEARALARQALMLGLSATVIYTELDPKCYTNEQLKEYLQ
jgi:Zn ribbon nucleic-acid-binding protein